VSSRYSSNVQHTHTHTGVVCMCTGILGFPWSQMLTLNFEQSVSGPWVSSYSCCSPSPTLLNSISVCVLTFSPYFHPVGGHMKQIWSIKVTLMVYFIWHEVGHTFLASAQPYPLSSDPDNEHRWGLTWCLWTFWSGVWWIHWLIKFH